jgi:hypothetical protein
VPDSLRSLIAGRKRIWFVRIHDVGEAAPEETWLRENAVVAKESKIGRVRIIDFRPKAAANF